MLYTLKVVNDPLTDAREMRGILKSKNLGIDIKEEQKRMKKEIHFVRKSSTLLPKSDPIFRIQQTLPSGKRLNKTAYL